MSHPTNPRNVVVHIDQQGGHAPTSKVEGPSQVLREVATEFHKPVEVGSNRNPAHVTISGRDIPKE